MSADASPMPARIGLLAPVRHRAFRWLLGARVATYLGNTVLPVALAFAVLDLTGSVIDLGIVVGARSIAMVVLLLLGGVIADRVPRAVILQGTSATAAASQLAIAAALLLGFASIPLLACLSVVNGAVGAASMPAALALTPQTVPAAVLRPANALARMGSSTATVIGTSTGGLITALLGPGWAIAATTITFAVAAACYRALGASHDRAIPTAARTSTVRQLRAGWQEFTARTWVWAVVLQFMIVNAAVVGCIQVLGPAIADATFGRTAWGFILAANTAGALVGGVLAAHWQPRRALCFGVALTMVESLPVITMAAAPHVAVLMAAMFLTGMAMEQFSIAWDMSLQEHVPADLLARVYSYDVIGSLVAVPIGEMTAGPVAAAVGNVPVLYGAAALILLATAAALTSRDVRTLPQRATDRG